MTVRMTGITGLLDTDALVSASMEPYKLKVNTQKQNLQVLQWQQDQYRKVMTDSKSFYDKYLDILGTNSLGKVGNYTTTKFTSNNESVVTATATNGATVDNYTVSVTQLASKATDSLNLPASDPADATIPDTTITIGGIDIAFTTYSDGAKTVASYNAAVAKKKEDLASDSTQLAKLNANTINATYSEFTGKVNFTASEMGKGGFKLSTSTGSAADKPLIATIKNSAGDEYKITDGTTNSKTIDGVTFNFNGKTNGTDAILTGKADITDFKANIVSFVNDYNTLLSSINTKIYETRDKSYTPLTDDQKADMSDNEIAKWEAKAQTGLLRKDSYLEDLARDMKDAMSTMMSSTGLSLEEIGIEPVQDYTDKNGLLTIDDDKLTNALETNFDNVKDLFTKGIATNDTKNGGVITKLKDSLNKDVFLSTSGLYQKAGTDTGSNALTNEMSKQLTEMKKKIAEMEDALTDREDTLYTKYASLESSLSALQAQQNSLASYFGTSS